MEQLKSHPVPAKRKFTFGALEIRKPDTADLVILSVFCVSIFIHLFFLNFYHFKKGIITTYFMIGLSAGMSTIATTMVTRFRSVYFSSIWLLLSIVFVNPAFSMTWIPLLTFLFYHLLRLLFWARYNREFIPFEKSVNSYLPWISKREGRAGDREDKLFTLILFWLGFIVVMSCVFGMAGLKLA